MTINVVGKLGEHGQKLLCFDADGAFVGGLFDRQQSDGKKNPFDAVIPTNAVTAKAGMLADAITFQLYYNGIKIAESTPTEIQ